MKKLILSSVLLALNFTYPSVYADLSQTDATVVNQVTANSPSDLQPVLWDTLITPQNSNLIAGTLSHASTAGVYLHLSSDLTENDSLRIAHALIKNKSEAVGLSGKITTSRSAQLFGETLGSRFAVDISNLTFQDEATKQVFYHALSVNLFRTNNLRYLQADLSPLNSADSTRLLNVSSLRVFDSPIPADVLSNINNTNLLLIVRGNLTWPFDDAKQYIHGDRFAGIIAHESGHTLSRDHYTEAALSYFEKRRPANLLATTPTYIQHRFEQGYFDEVLCPVLDYQKANHSYALNSDGQTALKNGAAKYRGDNIWWRLPVVQATSMNMITHAYPAAQIKDITFPSDVVNGADSRSLYESLFRTWRQVGKVDIENDDSARSQSLTPEGISNLAMLAHYNVRTIDFDVPLSRDADEAVAKLYTLPVWSGIGMQLNTSDDVNTVTTILRQHRTFRYLNLRFTPTVLADPRSTALTQAIKTTRFAPRAHVSLNIISTPENKLELTNTEAAQFYNLVKTTAQALPENAALSLSISNYAHRELIKELTNIPEQTKAHLYLSGRTWMKLNGLQKNACVNTTNFYGLADQDNLIATINRNSHLIDAQGATYQFKTPQDAAGILDQAATSTTGNGTNFLHDR